MGTFTPFSRLRHGSPGFALRALRESVLTAHVVPEIMPGSVSAWIHPLLRKSDKKGNVVLIAENRSIWSDFLSSSHAL